MENILPKGWKPTQQNWQQVDQCCKLPTRTTIKIMPVNGPTILFPWHGEADTRLSQLHADVFAEPSHSPAVLPRALAPAAITQPLGQSQLCHQNTGRKGLQKPVPPQQSQTLLEIPNNKKFSGIIYQEPKEQKAYNIQNTLAFICLFLYRRIWISTRKITLLRSSRAHFILMSLNMFLISWFK